MMRKTLIIALGTGLAVTPVAARERQITPYIEVAQVLTADLTNDDVLTYTTLAAGIDANVQTRRVQVQASYRYERRIGYDDRLADADIHSGLARAAVRVAAPLTIEGGALATRTRSDIRGAAPGVLQGNVANISQLYAIYAGPTFGSHIGPVGVSGGYRFGYTKVQAPSIVSPITGERRDVFDDSRSQQAQASLNLKSGTVLPVGITLSGAWVRDDASQLAQVYEGKYGRLDVLYPVLPTLALTAGVGYENIEISRRDALFDAAGQPVVNAQGRFQIDPNGQRRIDYNFDGLYYDAGVVWRPNQRTQLEVHAGERYGSFSAVGSFTYQASKTVAVRVSGYDGIQTFGRQLQTSLTEIPTAFNPGTNQLGQNFNGCVFGAQGGAAGNCLNSALQSVSTSAFRSRGVDAVISVTRGRTNFGLGAGYANRRYLASNAGPGIIIEGLEDESYYLQGYINHQLDTRTSIDANVFANYFLSGFGPQVGVYNIGATTTLNRRFGRFNAFGSVGIYNFGQDQQRSITSIQALLGGRYSF
ncbi:MAG: hypothetical protein H2054_10795 [Sphingomonas sp.]|uniref:hypothetical protein n=1 Tax=Sphingomonas sp. TaxID=28214 RepID=UPI001844207C|nr:hypothetical protein [Sphingomonas sp.]